MSIGPNELLAVGTPVRVGNLIGMVTSARMVRAHPSGFVAENTIRFTARRVRGFGNNYTIEPLVRSRSYAPNYSFIEVTG